MTVACIMMQRNEDAALEPWLRYHGHLFGFDSLHVIDHHSESPHVLRVLAHFERYGVQVTRLPATADFRDKAAFVSEGLQAAERTRRYDVLLPLDCDEFVAMRRGSGEPTCERETVRAYLRSLAERGGVFQVRENFLNTLGQPGIFWALPYQKVFFTRDNCFAVDGGSHEVADRPDIAVTSTRLVYVHFHFKSYEVYRRLCIEKLRPYVDVDDAAGLRSYGGLGAHLVQHLLKTRAEYMFMMTPDGNSIAFPELDALFAILGVDPRFCER